MSFRMSHNFLKLFSFTAVLLLAIGAAHSQQTQPQSAQQNTIPDTGQIIVVQITGEVYVFNPGDSLRFVLKVGSQLAPGQMISTGSKSSLMIAFSNGSTVTIGEESLVLVDEFKQKPFGEMFKISEISKEPSVSQTRLNLVRGELIADVKKLNKEEGSTFEVITPVGIAGIRGTTFLLAYTTTSSQNASGKTTPPDNTVFSLAMLDGSIEIGVPANPQATQHNPVLVTQGNRLHIEHINANANGSEMLPQDPDALVPSSIPPDVLAKLNQQVENMHAAVSDLSISATPGYPPPAAPEKVEPTPDSPKRSAWKLPPPDRHRPGRSTWDY